MLQLISQQNIQEAFSPGKLNDGSNINIGFRDNSYGFGWRIQNLNDGKMVWHTGHYPGISTLIMRYINIDRTIICLSNNGFEFYTIMNTINDLLKNQTTTLPHIFFAAQLRRIFIDNNLTSIDDSISMMITNKDNYVVSERRINDVGYDLLTNDRIDDAVTVFTCNTQLFPNSANVFDSLGEAFMLNAQYELAITNYKKSIELNPENKNAINMIQKIKQKNSENK